MLSSRLSMLYAAIEASGFTGVAVNAGPSLTYLTGLHFHLMERPVVMVFVPGGVPTIILPALEQRKLDHLAFEANVFTYGDDPNGWGEVFTKALAAASIAGGRIGVEPRQLRLLEYSYLQGGAKADYVDGGHLIAALRATKDADELAMMRRAVRIAEEGLEATLPVIRAGVSEKAIAAELFIQLMRAGAEGALPFSPIVAAGPNGANPHATPSERPLADGDLLIIDWGASYGGYAADLTRTFVVGEPGARAFEIHAAVKRANEAGRQAGAPGVACAAVDRATREVIDKAGYGPYFTHRTGHGIGMECHEDPYIHGGNETPLAAGNVYTVEPGIYLDGVGGVRIEDDVVVTQTGSESLSTMTRELRRVG